MCDTTGVIPPCSDVSGGRGGLFNSSKTPWGNERHFPNLKAPCLPDVNILFHPVREGISGAQFTSIFRAYVEVWISERFPRALLVSQWWW